MKQKKKTRTPIIDKNATEAKQFFLKHSSYANLSLPDYFNFEPLIRKVDRGLAGKSLSDYFINGKGPRDFENVNYAIFANKDGRHAWRRLELINPVIYIALVNEITKHEHWNLLQKRWKSYYREGKIHPMGMPVEADHPQKKDSAEQILQWWEGIEQESIKSALDFQVIAHTDIADCYSQMYTHSIAWSIHGKQAAKDRRDDQSLLGNIIDRYIQHMHYGQTNGIPQGSVLMDFIAEFVLGYADSILLDRLEENNDKLSNYKILRYRDDYRIFTMSDYEAHFILKELSTTLAEIGLQLNTHKTKICTDIISSSVKLDKIEWLGISQHKNITKYLLTIYRHSVKHPNSGSILAALASYYTIISKSANYDPDVLISILTNLAITNPRAMPIISGIISVIVDKKLKGSRKRIAIDKIQKSYYLPPTTLSLRYGFNALLYQTKYRLSRICRCAKKSLKERQKSGKWHGPIVEN